MTLDRVKRFSLSERVLHWLVACAFVLLLVSGLVVGRRGAFHDAVYTFHLAVAGALLAGSIALGLYDRPVLAASARELCRLDSADSVAPQPGHAPLAARDAHGRG
jgi:cytochrome b subunit of formate dehydrogenase